MTKNSELSIIVPVYNVQEQLRTCLDSLINQSYKNIEFFIIDDSSTDDSPNIIKEYAKKYENLKPIFLEKNHGVGYVRNYGITMCKGEYIGFVDSDDWIDVDYYQKLLSSIKKNDSDIAACGIITEYDNSYSYKLRYKYDFENCINGNFALKLLTKSENYGHYITPIVNNKIYNRKFLKTNNIVFNDNRSFQDDYFSFFAMLYAKKVVLLPNTNYHYYQRTNSITHTFSKRLVDDCINTLVQIRTDLVNQKLIEIYEKEYYSYVERLLTSLLDMLIRKEPEITTQKKYLKYIMLNLSKNFHMHKIIEYLDNRRIFNFFGLT
ncbi:MAG: glycosyltransferase [Alistipes sp.]|nr:glycosyltransferase [Alistipes sp.]